MVGHASEVERGETAVLRSVFNGRVGTATAVTVVEDTPSRVALYLPAGAAMRWMEGELPLWMDTADSAKLVNAWQRTNVLILITPGQAHAIWLMWLAETGAFLCWVVNMQAPIERSRFGWDTFDHELEVYVLPDLRWAWRDEDKFERLVELGPFTRPQGAVIRAEAESVIADVEARRAPFDQPWPDWKPDPSWPTPALPIDWDRP
jgi:hypothetical protein